MSAHSHGDGTGGDTAPAGGPAGRYRLDDATIRRLNRRVFGVLLGALALAALVAIVGLVIFLVSGRDDTVLDRVSGPMYAVAAVIALVGVVACLGMGAYFGGESLRRGGGAVGLALALGVVAIAVGSASGRRGVWAWTFWGGIVLTGLAAVGFFVLGRAARVPMWLQLPVPGGRRLYLTRGAAPAHPATRGSGGTRSFRLHGQAGEVDVTVPGVTEVRRTGHGRHEEPDPPTGD